MTKIRSTITTIAVMVMVTALGMATPAQANLQIQLSVDNSHWQTVASDVSGGTATFSAGTSSAGWKQTNITPNVDSGIRISGLTVFSDSPGAPYSASLNGSGTLTNVTSSTKTLYIKLGDTGFTGPKTPPGLATDSSISGNVSVGSGGSTANNKLTFQSYVDPNNGQNTTPVIYALGTQSPTVTAVGGYTNDLTGSVSSLMTTYSMTQYFKVVLGPKAQLSISTLTSLTKPVPEPSSMAIAGFGAMGLLLYGLRRRQLG